MEIINIPKEIFNTNYDKQVYLFKHFVSNKNITFLFKYDCYFVYLRGYNIVPYKELIKKYLVKNYIV